MNFRKEIPYPPWGIDSKLAKGNPKASFERLTLKTVCTMYVLTQQKLDKWATIGLIQIPYHYAWLWPLKYDLWWQQWPLTSGSKKKSYVYKKQTSKQTIRMEFQCIPMLKDFAKTSCESIELVFLNIHIPILWKSYEKWCQLTDHLLRAVFSDALFVLLVR